jgi:hypothetical protein
MIALVAAVIVQAQDPGLAAPALASPPPSPAAVALDTGRLRHANGRVPPVATARRVATAPHVDGRLDDAVWAEAEPVTALVQNEPQEGQPVSEATEVRIVYDDDAIYVGARMYDREPHLVRAELSRRDNSSAADFIRVAFDSYLDHRSAFSFEVNPSGVRSDVRTANDDGFGDDGWDPVWDAHAARDSLGWTAEMRIPFSQLRYSTADEQVWGINVVRWIQRKGESAELGWKARTERGYASYFGHLFGLSRLPQPKRLEALPYATARQEASPARPGDPFNDGTVGSGAAGLDLKYGVTSSLTLDATFNPDFGQVEQDPAFVNLSAFEQFLDERRPFFVEGADLFRFGGAQLFYSRRIGRPPQGFPPDDSLGHTFFYDIPENSTILGAGKLTGRSGPWTLGILESVTGREYAVVRDSTSGLDSRHEVEPLTNSLVARARRDMRGGATTVGVIATAVNRDLRDPDLLFLRSSAYAGGLDFTHRFGRNTWSLSGALAYARIAGDTAAIRRAQTSSARYYQRPDADHVELDPARTSLAGAAGQLSFGRIRGNWTWTARGSFTTPGFEVNDLGFQGRADQASANLNVQRRWTRPGRVFRQANIGFDLGGNWNFGGVRTNFFTGTYGYGQFLNYWSVNYSIGVNPIASLSDNLTRGGPLGYSAPGGSVFLGVETDYRKPWQVFVGANYFRNEIGADYAGLFASISARPTSAIRLSVGPEISTSRTVQQYVTAAADPLATATYGTAYVFGEIAQHTLDLTTRLDVTFTPDLSLQLFAQPFAADGAYTNLKELRTPRAYDFRVFGRDDGSTLVPFCFDDAGSSVVCGAPGAPPPSYYEADPDGPGPRPLITVGNPDFTVRSLRGTAVLRWEYRPGSTLFLVWSTDCGFFSGRPQFQPFQDVRRLCSGRSSNAFAVKFNYWLSL